jgi:hypothetical protein
MLSQEMISSHPDAPSEPVEAIVLLLDEAATCAQTCLACADACLAEDAVPALTHCIRLNNDCADVCETLTRLLYRLLGPNTGVQRGMIELCAMTCEQCADECDRHAAHHLHCRLCAETCRRCAEQCRITLQTFI